MMGYAQASAVLPPRSSASLDKELVAVETGSLPTLSASSSVSVHTASSFSTSINIPMKAGKSKLWVSAVFLKAAGIPLDKASITSEAADLVLSSNCVFCKICVMT
jgi:hypothetical protein